MKQMLLRSQAARYHRVDSCALPMPDIVCWASRIFEQFVLWMKSRPWSSRMRSRAMGCTGSNLTFNLLPTTRRSEEHTSELQSRGHLVCRLLLEKKKKKKSENQTEKTT